MSAHADDGEVAAGGVINQMVEKGMDVYYVAFSIAEESVPPNFAKDIVEKECREATNILGIPAQNTIIFRYPVRKFSSFRQEILDELIKIKNELEIDCCFTPSTTDIHQDHSVVCNETIRAFQKSASIYGYDFPWNVVYTPKLNLFYELSEQNLATKILALKSYQSQMTKPNNCFTDEYIKSLAAVRGNMIGVKYAEAFESIREIRSYKHG